MVLLNSDLYAKDKWRDIINKSQRIINPRVTAQWSGGEQVAVIGNIGHILPSDIYC
jgi:hypothetical protein